jgi:hypothetical protein
MAEHTPGPWSVTRDGYVRPDVYKGADGSTWPSICHASPWPAKWGLLGKDEQAANARLIAAAPAMAEQIAKDAARFRSFARFALDSGWSNLAAEFDGFAAEAERTLRDATGKESR